jgi:uncharacterized membrane protein
VTKSFTIASLASLAFLVVVDFVWLSNAINFLYRPKLGSMLLEKPLMWAAVLFYLLYGTGMAVIAIRPALADGSVLTALWMGAFMGLVAYGTYDLTNLATLKGWSVTITLVDMAWGAFITGVSCAFGVWVAQKVG